MRVRGLHQPLHKGPPIPRPMEVRWLCLGLQVLTAHHQPRLVLEMHLSDEWD